MLHRGERCDQTFLRRWCSRDWPGFLSVLSSLVWLSMYWVECHQDSYFFIDVIDKLFELGGGAVVTMSKSWYLIFAYHSLIILSCWWSQWIRHAHVMWLHSFSSFACFRRMSAPCSRHESYSSLLRLSFSPFRLFLLFWPTGPCFASHKHLAAIEFCSQSNEIFYPPASSFSIPTTFLSQPVGMSEGGPLGKLLVSNLASTSLLTSL